MGIIPILITTCGKQIKKENERNYGDQKIVIAIFLNFQNV